MKSHRITCLALSILAACDIPPATDNQSIDLEAMSRAGPGGALIFNARLGLPDGPVRFMSDEWPGWMLKGEERPATERVSWSTRKDYSKDDPLLPSGLMGPVQLIFAVEN